MVLRNFKDSCVEKCSCANQIELRPSTGRVAGNDLLHLQVLDPESKHLRAQSRLNQRKHYPPHPEEQEVAYVGTHQLLGDHLFLARLGTA